MQITISINHPAYQNLVSLTEPEEMENLNCDQKLSLLKDGLKILLASWARCEELEANTAKRTRIQNIRFEWGQKLDHFFE